MSEAEFIHIYINASEEDQARIEETLRSFQTEPVSQETDFHIDYIKPSPFLSSRY